MYYYFLCLKNIFDKMKRKALLGIFNLVLIVFSQNEKTRSLNFRYSFRVS